MSVRLNIRVTKDDKNNVKYEVMQNGEKIGDTTAIDIIEMAMQFTSSLRWVGK